MRRRQGIFDQIRGDFSGIPKSRNLISSYRAHQVHMQVILNDPSHLLLSEHSLFAFWYRLYLHCRILYKLIDGHTSE